MSPNISGFAGPSSRGYNLMRGTGIVWQGQVAANFSASTTTTFSMSITQAVPANTTLLVTARGGGGSSQYPTSCADSKGNTYVLDVRSANPTLTNVAIFSAFITTPLTTSDTITVTYLTSGTNRHIIANQFDGILPSSSSRLYSSFSNYSNTNTTSVTMAVPSYANRGDMFFGALGIAINTTSGWLYAGGLTRSYSSGTSQNFVTPCWSIQYDPTNANSPAALWSGNSNYGYAYGVYRAAP